MAQFKVKVPPTKDQGNFVFNITTSHNETASQAALWHYNSASMSMSCSSTLGGNTDGKMSAQAKIARKRWGTSRNIAKTNLSIPFASSGGRYDRQSRPLHNQPGRSARTF